MTKTQTPKEQVKDTVTRILPHKAFSVVKDAEKQLYYLVEIPFDGVNGLIGNVTKTPVGHDKLDGIEAFKVAASNSHIFGEQQ